MDHKLRTEPLVTDSWAVDETFVDADGIVASGAPLTVNGRRYVSSRPFSARQFGPILEFMSRTEDETVHPVLYGAEAAISNGWLHPDAA